MIKTKGIIIGIKPFLEADKLVSVYTPSHGKLQLLAKYARKSTRRFAGKLELTNYISIIYSSRKSIFNLIDCHIYESYSQLRCTLQANLLAQYVCHTLSTYTMPESANAPLFHLLHQTLSTLNSKTIPKDLKASFQKSLLTIEGLRKRGSDLSNERFKHITQDYTGQLLWEPT